jgi:DNA invertase Pin-like site-specific DNA recombinase
MGNILGYARASTSDQDNAGQIAQLILTGATNVFCDMGSAPSTDRSGLAALLAAVRPGDVVAVAGLDRLGRTIKRRWRRSRR